MTIKELIARYPVPTYYALVFAISWGGILIVVGPAGIIGTKYNPLALAQFVYLAALAGPSVAGVLMTALVDGRGGFRELLSRLCRWRVGAHWYALALLTAPLVTMGILFVLSLTSPAFLPTIVTAQNKAGLLLSGIVLGLCRFHLDAALPPNKYCTKRSVPDSIFRVRPTSKLLIAVP